MESLDRIVTHNFFNLGLTVLVDEFVDMHESTAHSDLDLITLLYFDEYALLSELVDAFRFSEEQNLHLLFLGIRIEIVGQGLVDLVAALTNVDRLVLVEFVVFFEQLLDFVDCLLLVILQILELLKQIELRGLRSVQLFLQLCHLVVHVLDVELQLLPRFF